MYHDIGCYWISEGNIGELTPNIGNNALLLLLYALFGIGFPLLPSFLILLKNYRENKKETNINIQWKIQTFQ